MEFYFPVLIVVLSNTIYHICAKSAPTGVSTFASLSVTYAVGTVTSLALYFLTQKNADILAEYSRLNWSSLALGAAVVGLESGFLLMYKVGWDVSTAQLTASALLEIVLIFVGLLLYHEAITPQKLAGIAVCAAGLYLMSRG